MLAADLNPWQQASLFSRAGIGSLIADGHYRGRRRRATAANTNSFFDSGRTAFRG